MLPGTKESGSIHIYQNAIQVVLRDSVIHNSTLRTKRLFSLLPGSEFFTPAYVVNVSALEDSICQPPCECDHCQTGFYAAEEQFQPQFSYRRVLLDDDDAKGIIKSYVTQTETARARLAVHLRSHADIVMSDWEKRTEDERQTLLKNAAPDLEERQGILPRYSRMVERKLIHARSLSRRRQLLLPWLSVEILKINPAVLFALLHYRTLYPPQEWAGFDCRQMSLSWAYGWLDVDYSARCMVMYGSRYGDLVEWEAGAIHPGDFLGFPRARLVVEAQAYLMEVLYNVVDNILGGGEVAFWSPYANQAFCAPPLLDIGYLWSLAKTRLDVMGDHASHLPCNVTSIRRQIKILRGTEIYKIARNSDVGSLLARNIYQEALRLYWWRWIENACRHVDNQMQHLPETAHIQVQPFPVRHDRASGYSADRNLSRGATLPPSLLKVIRVSSVITPAFPKGTALFALSRPAPTNTNECLRVKLGQLRPRNDGSRFHCEEERRFAAAAAFVGE